MSARWILGLASGPEHSISGFKIPQCIIKPVCNTMCKMTSYPWVCVTSPKMCALLCRKSGTRGYRQLGRSYYGDLQRAALPPVWFSFLSNPKRSLKEEEQTFYGRWCGQQTMPGVGCRESEGGGKPEEALCGHSDGALADRGLISLSGVNM